MGDTPSHVPCHTRTIENSPSLEIVYVRQPSDMAIRIIGDEKRERERERGRERERERERERKERDRERERKKRDR